MSVSSVTRVPATRMTRPSSLATSGKGSDRVGRFMVGLTMIVLETRVAVRRHHVLVPRVGAGLDGGLGARPALLKRSRPSRAGRASTHPSRPAPTRSQQYRKGSGAQLRRAT